MLTQTFRVPDMHCNMCVLRLESLEDQLAGVRRITASYHKQHMVVEYDEHQITAEQIMEAVRRLGYENVTGAG